MANKLILTRWEKYLYNFVLNVHLSHERKIHTANIVKFTIKVWYLKRKNKSKSIRCFQTQWKLFQSIRAVQQVKLEKRKLIDNWIALPDLYNLQQDGNDQIETIVKQLNTMKLIINRMKENFNDLNHTLNNIQRS